LRSILNVTNVGLNQRCPTHSPLATCGEWLFKIGEWLHFEIVQNKVLFGDKEDLQIKYNFLCKHVKQIEERMAIILG